ncbi:MAG: JAB domain-containing protein [Bdellovibrionales bacterium]|nr:JAB domain-containing protein [Bdellovibrionales bacterium]
MKVASSREAYNYLHKLLTSDVEEFWVTTLRSDKSVIRSTCLFRGTVDNCPVHPRDIFRFACMQNASSIIVSHNHPSQDPHPSLEDQRVTRQIVKAGQLLCIPLLDHIIVTNRGYWSYADRRVYKITNDLFIAAPST